MSITESSSLHDNLDQLSVTELTSLMNGEDQKVASAVEEQLPQINALVEQIELRMRKGGRLFYIGAGTSGRLGILDASECPPTFGVPHGLVVGIIAGGDTAIRKAVEFAEDDNDQAWKDIAEYDPTENDTVIGLAASGRTPYVIGGVKKAKEEGLLTGCIVCNPNSILASEVQCPVEIVVGPEFVTGSTRLKSGTAQKMALNLITTTVMIRLGKVKGNKMVDMQLSNEKLVDRGTKMVMQELGIERDRAEELLNKYGSVRDAISHFKG
ncbi:MAG: N-acetylmuramic acid 6-phosphate etherase [Cyclobacteriaceae bacterium]